MNRIYLLCLVLLASFSLSSCFPEPKDNNEVYEQFFKNLDEIRKYIKDNNITGVDSLNSGLFYKIVDIGNDQDYPLDRGLVRVEYIAKKFDGTVFIDTYEVPDSQLIIWGTTNLIKAMEQGIERISEGGIIEVYSPSILAYNDIGYSNIVKAYEPVIFRIEIVDIMNVPGAQ